MLRRSLLSWWAPAKRRQWLSELNFYWLLCRPAHAIAKAGLQLGLLLPVGWISNSWLLCRLEEFNVKAVSSLMVGAC
jgi:hypothetical protein